MRKKIKGFILNNTSNSEEAKKMSKWFRLKVKRPFKSYHYVVGKNGKVEGLNLYAPE